MTRRGLALAGAALVVMLLLLGCGDGSRRTATGTPPTTTPSTAVTSTPPTMSTTSTTAGPTTTPSTATTVPPTVPPTTAPTSTVPPPAGGTLQRGSAGPDVLALEVRLSGLGFWLGSPDTQFGGATHHAVVAFQKWAGLPRDGVVGAATRAALATATRPAPRSSAGRVVEIDLARQLLFVADGGRLVWAFDTSTGRVPGTTPVGRWQITREIDGIRVSPLGRLYRPKYFHRGVAVHGYTSVPPLAASHGCVRVTYEAMDHIWAAGLAPVGTPVWVLP